MAPPKHAPPSTKEEVVVDSVEAAQAAAANAVLKLSSLWKASKNAKLLQHPPPTTLSKQTSDLFGQSSFHIAVLLEVWPSYLHMPVLLDGLLEAIMPYKPAVTLGRLAAWLQCKPELLQLAELSADVGSLPASSPGRLWLNSIEAICLLDAAASGAQKLCSGYDSEFETQLAGTGLLDKIPDMLKAFLCTLMTAPKPQALRPVAAILKLLLARKTSGALINIAHLLPGHLQVIFTILEQRRYTGCAGLSDGSSSSSSGSCKSGISSIHSSAAPSPGPQVPDRHEAAASVEKQTAALVQALVHTTYVHLVPLQQLLIDLAFLSMRLPGRAGIPAALIQLKVDRSTGAAGLLLLSVQCRMLHDLQQQQLQGMPWLLGPMLCGRQLQQCLHLYRGVVPALHMRLPGLQPSEQYVAAGRQHYWDNCGPGGVTGTGFYGFVNTVVSVLEQHMYCQLVAHTGRPCPSSKLLQPAAVQLLLEFIQLTWLEQQQERQEQGGDSSSWASTELPGKALAALRHQLYSLARLPAGLNTPPAAVTSSSSSYGSSSSSCQLTVLQACGLQLLKVLTFLMQSNGLEAELAGSDAAAEELRKKAIEAAARGLPVQATGDVYYSVKHFRQPAQSITEELLLILCALTTKQKTGLSQLTCLAAAHPVYYFIMAETCLRCKLEPLEILLPLELIKQGVMHDEKTMASILSNAAAAAAVGSAVASLVKYCVTILAEPVATPKNARADAARAGLAAVLPCVYNLLQTLANNTGAGAAAAVKVADSTATTGCASSSSSSNSEDSVECSKGSQQVLAGAATATGSSAYMAQGMSCQRQLQAHTSRIFLLLLVARSLVVLHDALAAASADGNPASAFATAAAVHAEFTPCGVLGGGQCFEFEGLPLVDGLPVADKSLWQEFVCDALAAFTASWSHLMSLLDEPKSHMQRAPLEAAAPGPTPRQQTSSVNHGIDHQQQQQQQQQQQPQQRARWQYLTGLMSSRKLSSAREAYVSKWGSSSMSSGNKQDVTTMYEDALQLCRVLVAVAPLPVVCNNPQCDNLAGLTEAVAAGKECGACGARYCCSACRDANWLAHKKACRRVSAAGQSVNHRAAGGQ